MASLRAQNLNLPALRPTRTTRNRLNYCRASFNFPSDLSPERAIEFQNVRPMIKLDELTQNQQYTVFTEITKRKSPKSPKENAKLRVIAEALADRAEMHDIIGRQRNNWNHHFLHSINSFALSASLMTGISSSLPSHLLAFKLSSMLLLSSAACMMLVVNKIQPSQLAEEQRNATRLSNKLGREINQMLTTKSRITKEDVSDVMDKVIALDKAYPLGLLPGMLEKFPEQVKPTRWWPKKQSKKTEKLTGQNRREGNGWSKELEDQMTGLLKVIKMKDESNYIELGKLILGVNKGLAISGPVIAGLAAIATGLVDSPIGGLWAPMASVVGGALVAVVNTFEHGAQLGMIFEILRNCAGLFCKLQEEIECNLSETEVEKRENGEIFAMKVALELGMNVSDLKEFARFASPSCQDEDIKEFASRLI
ncbi:hypothetical protein LUZ60_012309 [Juncus effusus]|nr:hypothetical protein LUZ60_012309 [Juncus effusus]